uniref:BTB domain-containing protein n=1 Tax=Homalodisca liturata TaxID=320908 RepID=A0A1B6IDU7_9HEMI
MDDQEYSLRWNNHQPNFISVFKSLLELEELVDVTLSVEGKHIKAHKVILSACSPYFKLLFTVAPSKHPIVILSEMKYNHLKTIVDFMYQGEISISDEQLPDILEVAEALQVRGLFDPNKKTENASSEQRAPAKKRKRKSETNGDNKVVQGEMIPQDMFEQMNSSDLGCEGLFDPKKWLQDDNHIFTQEFSESPSDSLSMVMPKIRLQEMNNGGLGLLHDQSMHNILPHINKPGPGRRRSSSKVQDSENFLQALEAVRSGSLGFCKAAKLYGLNNRTLWLEYKKRGYPSNRPPVNLRQKSSPMSAKTS